VPRACCATAFGAAPQDDGSKIGANFDILAVLTVVEPQITREIGVIRRKGEGLSSAAREFVASLGEA
jgi:hypothetical protein